MTDKQAYEAVKKMTDTIYDQCVEYAKKDGLPYSVVFKAVGEGLLRLSEKAEERGI